MARKEKIYHYIYKTINILNDNYYIGMHSTDNLNDGYIGSGVKLRYAIRKYGIENFKLTILEFLPNRSSLKEREIELVNIDLLDDIKCMNLALGGIGGIHNEEHKCKLHAGASRYQIEKWKKSTIQRYHISKNQRSY